MAGRVRKGPCAHRACKKPDGNENTQWTFIPDSFHGDGLREGSCCVCRLAECREHVGLPPLGQKRQAVAEGVAVQPALQRPKFVRRIDEIWGVRCACGVCAPPPPPFCSDLTALRGRYANLAELGEEERENKLEAKTVEYLVHGLFARSEKGMGEGKNGLPGAWWFDLDQILATIAEDDLKQKLQAFEQAQLATRDEAIAAAMERKEAAAADD